MRKPLHRYPKIWNGRKVKEVIRHYERQTEEEATAEDEAVYRSTRTTMMSVPVGLVPAVLGSHGHEPSKT
ncbi:MAG: hypothetical protein AB1716_03385 [Planctomycetota bacterium]